MFSRMSELSWKTSDKTNSLSLNSLDTAITAQKNESRGDYWNPDLPYVNVGDFLQFEL